MNKKEAKEKTIWYQIDKALRKDIEYAVCSGVFSVRYYKLLGFEKESKRELNI